MGSRNTYRPIIFVLILLINMSLVLVPISAYSENAEIKVIVYTSPLCPTCKAFNSMVHSMGIQLEERSLTNSEFLKEYEAIINVLELDTKLTPLAIILRNCSVIAIAYGIGDRPSDQEFISKIVKGDLKYVVILPAGVEELEINDIKRIEKIIKCGVEPIEIPPLPSLITLVTSLALSDSVNPCTLYLYILLLVSASLITLSERPAKKHVLGVGIAFMLAIMAGYILLGLGLLTVVSIIPKYVFIAIGLGFGLWTIISTLKGKGRIISKGKILGFIPKASENIAISAFLGLLATFTLLPCSAGPYLVFIGIASRLPKLSALGLLLYYNVLFITPLIALLLAVLIGISHESIRNFILKNHVKVSILAGSLLIAIAIYALFLPI